MNVRAALLLVLAALVVAGCRPNPEADAPAVPEEFSGDPDGFPGHPDGFGPDPSAPAAGDPADRPGEAVVATWNAGSLFSPADVSARAADFAALARDVRPDVLLLDEVNSRETAEAVAAALGMPTGPQYVVASDFNPNDDAQYSSLEVAILSRFPLTDAVEFDRGTDGNSRPGYPPERKLERVGLDGIADSGVGRGFLAADVPALGIVAVVTHLKSSSGRSGEEDRDNARKRELVAAAMARHVAERLAADRNLTAVVGGDFNVGETDAGKLGRDPADDRTDGYDDTHALMTLGLVDGLRLRSLTRDMGNTYDDTPGDNAFPYPGVGAIDVLYVGGAEAERFSEARRGSDTFGSDHYPVRAALAP